jgi:hypothetical protein
MMKSVSERISESGISVAAPKFIPTNISTKKPVKILISAHSGSKNLAF